MKKITFALTILLITITSFASLKTEKDNLQDQLRQEASTIKSKEDYMNLLAKQDKSFTELLAKYDVKTLNQEDKLVAVEIMLMLKKAKEALVVLDSVEKSKDNSELLNSYYSKTYFATGDKEKGEKFLGTLDKNGNFYGNICIEEGYSLLQQNKIEEGSKYFEKALTVSNLDMKIKAQVINLLSNVYDHTENKEKLNNLIAKYEDDKTVPVQITTQLKGIKNRLAMVGQPAFDFLDVSTWVKSPKLTLESLKGKAVILDFFAPWCAPCRQAMPILNDLYKKHKDKLVVVGITPLEGNFFDGTTKEEKITKERETQLIVNFLKEKEYPVAITSSKEMAKKYGVKGIPHFVIIDKNGNIAKTLVGFGGEKEFAKTVESYLK